MEFGWFPLCHSLFFFFISFFHAFPHLCSFPYSPPLLPSNPSPLFSSCCVILILHTLLLWTMNNAWCVRNPQCHAWLPASITELASLLRRWTGKRGEYHKGCAPTLFVFSIKAPVYNFFLQNFYDPPCCHCSCSFIKCHIIMNLKNRSKFSFIMDLKISVLEKLDTFS